jgi:hypothetical protein
MADQKNREPSWNPEQGPLSGRFQKDEGGRGTIAFGAGSLGAPRKESERARSHHKRRDAGEPEPRR